MVVKTSLSAVGLVILLNASLGFAIAPQIDGRTTKGSGDYNVYGKNATKHNITLYGNGKGRYCLNGNSNCGDLFDIIVNGPEADIAGKWKINGSQGTFQWNFQDDNNFEGGFRFNQNMKESAETGSIYTPYDGEWKGRLD